MIRLQFSRQPGICSSLIAWFGKGEFSHVDAHYYGGLLGARTDHNPGVQVRPSEYANFSKKMVFEIPSTEKETQRFENFLSFQIGKPYDHLAILGFITGRNWREPDSWVCSELQAAALEYSGVVGPLYLAVNKIDPSTLASTVSAIKGTTYHDV